MPWNDPPENGKNPWGRRDGGRKNNPWGNAGGNGPEQPDLDDMLKRAQDNLRQVMPGDFGSARFLGLGILAIIALWLASGFFIIEPGEYGVIQRFGAWSRTKSEEGLGYRLPWPVETVEKVNVAEIRRMSIGFVESFTRGQSGQKQDIPEESLMLTFDRNIVDLDLVVLWNIKSAEDFLFNVQEQENTIKKVAESAIREVVGQRPMFSIITRERDAVAQKAQEIIQTNMDEYNSGVSIAQVLIQQAEVHPDVQDAFQDVQSAKQDAEDVQNRAEAYREDILPKARGRAIQMVQEAQAYKESAIARATGDADRFNKIHEAYLKGEDVTKERLYIEAMESVMKNAKKIIIDSKGGQNVVPYLPLNELQKSQSTPKATQ